MTIYLSSTNNAQLFDFMQVESLTTIQKFIGKFSFSNFCKKDMRKLGHALYVAVEIAALKDNLEELLTTVKNFELQYTARLIFVTVATQDEVCTRLHQCEQHNIIVLSANEADVQRQIRECFSCEGMAKSALPPMVTTTKIIAPIEPPLPTKQMEVLVAGTQFRVGTTMAALQMVTVLAKSGLHVAYVEVNDSGHLSQLMSERNVTRNDETVWKINTAVYCHIEHILSPTVNVVVYDIGVLGDDNVDAFCSTDTDTAILVGGAGGHELGHVYKALERVRHRQVQLLLTNVSSHQSSRLTMLLEGKHCKVRTVERVGDWQDAEAHEIMWREMLVG